MNVLGENTAEVFFLRSFALIAHQAHTHPWGELETHWSSDQESLQTRTANPMLPGRAWGWAWAPPTLQLKQSCFLHICLKIPAVAPHWFIL